MLTVLTNELPKELERIFSYYKNAEGRVEPAMYVIREGYFGRAACITESSAYLYDEPHRQTSRMLMETAVILAEMMANLGIPCNRSTVEKFRMFIQDGLEDLKKMPPYDGQRRVIGEADVFLDGKRSSIEILE